YLSMWLGHTFLDLRDRSTQDARALQVQFLKQTIGGVARRDPYLASGDNVISIRLSTKLMYCDARDGCSIIEFPETWRHPTASRRVALMQAEASHPWDIECRSLQPSSIQRNSQISVVAS